MTTKTRPFTLL